MKHKYSIFTAISFLSILILSCSGATDDLWHAITFNDVNKARQALDDGADVNAVKYTVMSTTSGRTITVYTNTRRMYTPLMMAAAGGDDQMIRLLLSRGADIRLKDHEGKSAISYAIMNRHASMMVLLIKAGVDPNLKGDLGITPVMDAAMTDCVECLDVLHTAKALLVTRTPSGMNALLYAAEYGSTEALRFLLDRGMDANSCDNFGKTALIYAAKKNRLDAVKLLVLNGARVDGCGSDGRTALFWAAVLGREEMTKYLLAHGARPKVYASNGQSALGLAKKNGHAEIVSMLLKAGAL